MIKENAPITAIYPVSVRFTGPERDRIHDAAHAEDRSASNMVRILCREALAAREAKAAKK
jgi:hypothetical protein